MFEEEQEKSYLELQKLADAAMEECPQAASGADAGEQPPSDCEVVEEVSSGPPQATPEVDPKSMASAAAALLQAVTLKMQSMCFGAINVCVNYMI